MRFANAAECWRVILKDLRRDLLPEIERFARENKMPTEVVFGTSGWRGEIGTDFTFRNVKIVTRAIIETLKTDNSSLKAALGIKDFSDVKKRGIIVGHDNRFLAREFAETVMGLLAAEGIRVYYAGETTTPEISAAILMLSAACSINITPSHNPANYSGLKFNPADGGPAGPEITNYIQQQANALMSEIDDIDDYKAGYESIDTTDLYVEFLNRNKTIDLQKIRDFISSGRAFVVVDHVHGATRGRPERLLGTDDPAKVRLLRTEDDYLFGGVVAPEPSAANMKEVELVLQQSDAPYRIGVIMDPDGDRIRFADHKRQIPMNYFGAMALHFLHVYKGIQGVAVKSVGTSNFVNAIATKLGIKVIETKVGFKNFRPYMLEDSRERAIVAFEESDGISGFNHTLEKDALFGLLLAIEMVATTGKNLSEYLEELMQQFGFYYPDRSGIEVDRSLGQDVLKKKVYSLKEIYPPGSTVRVGAKELKIVDIISIDGIKFVLEDGSWFMIRPSGTEPKVRFYIESRNPEDKEDIFGLARRLTEEVVSTGV